MSCFIVMPLGMYSVDVCGRELVNFTGQSHIEITLGKGSFVVTWHTSQRNRYFVKLQPLCSAWCMWYNLVAVLFSQKCVCAYA